MDRGGLVDNSSSSRSRRSSGSNLSPAALGADAERVCKQNARKFFARKLSNFWPDSSRSVTVERCCCPAPRAGRQVPLRLRGARRNKRNAWRWDHDFSSDRLYVVIEAFNVHAPFQCAVSLISVYWHKDRAFTPEIGTGCAQEAFLRECRFHVLARRFTLFQPSSVLVTGDYLID